MIVCSPQLGLNPNSILGGEVFDREILLGLAKKRVKVEIILPEGKSHDKNVQNWHITILSIKHFPAILGNLLIIPYFFKVYSKSQFQIIRLHSPRYLGIGALLFKIFKPKVKIVATYHQFGESNFGPFSKMINNAWDHIICDSQNVRNRLIKTYQLPSAKITVVHNGAPSYLKPGSKDKIQIKKLKLKGKIVLLFMGLFIDRKNPLFLLNVLSKLSQERSDIVLIFWGDGPLKSQILQKAKELRVDDKIRIIGPVFGPGKNKIHNLADIFVHPSIDEGFALAPLEAMACAKPIVITSGYSAAEAVEDGVNGFFCRPSETNQWAKKTQDLIDNSKLRERMGQASFMKVKREFQWRFSVEKHLEVFKRLLQ